MRPSFITIEGCIGAGKTTFAKKLAELYNAPLILENFEDNPYLQNFYDNPDRHAFSLELYFMAERYKQQKNLLDQINLFDERIITDYAFFKSFIFSGITLKQEDEQRLFKMLYSIIFPNIKAPDIILYLHKPVEILMKNIKKRGRDYESAISRDYLDQLNNSYLEYFKQQTTSTILIADTSDLDFVKHSNDFEYLETLLSAKYTKKMNYI